MKKSSISPMPEYYDRYIDLVDDVELFQAFRESRLQLDQLDAGLLEALENRSYAPGKWSVKEIFQHLIDAERILGYRALRFARNDKTPAGGFDQDQFTLQSGANARPLRSLIAELKIVRISTQAMFDSFSNEMLLNTGTSWKYTVSTLGMGFLIIGHQAHHLQVIREKYMPLLQA